MIDYKLENHTKVIDIHDFVKEYVDVSKFLKYCKECTNYNMIWSCPEYDFEPMDIWNRYNEICLVLVKIIYDKGLIRKSYTKEELAEIIDKSVRIEKKHLFEQYLIQEKEIPESMFLSAGSCDLCDTPDSSGLSVNQSNCTRPHHNPCRHPEKLRYSIESLGGDVVRIAKELFDIEMKWSGGTNLPEYYVLVSGLLK